MRLVTKITEDIDVTSKGREHNVKLSRADGMIGACPVFDNYDKALERAGGDKDMVERLNIKL